MSDALIVGAGVAAASAATALTAAGWQVCILDKADRPGGRCATRHQHAEAAGSWFDYGAQYFTARDPVFRAIVDVDLAAGRLVRWQPDIRVAEYSTNGWRLTASPDERERLIGPTGLNAWINARLADSGAHIRSGARVTAVTPTSAGWRARLDDGEALYADAVVVTTPAPQTVALLGDLAASVPALAGADRALRACHALVVEAPALAGCHGLFVKHGVLSWLADNSHKAGQDHLDRHLWTLHATPEFSDDHLDTPPDTVQRSLIEAFAAIGGFPAAAITPVYFHRWRYARPGVGAPGALDGDFGDAARGLALAGDWLAGGRVEGAWLAGRAAALALMRR